MIRSSIVIAGLAFVAIPVSTRAGANKVDIEPTGFVLWTAPRLQEAADELERTIGDKALVFETIGNYPGHSVYLVLRGTSGQAEFHETEADLFVARRGRATLVIGGELVNEQTLTRKQRRGTAIRGGIQRVLTPGDIVHIPKAIPHQLLVAPGERFMYDLVKFDEEPLGQ